MTHVPHSVFIMSHDYIFVLISIFSIRSSRLIRETGTQVLANYSHTNSRIKTVLCVDGYSRHGSVVYSGPIRGQDGCLRGVRVVVGSRGNSEILSLIAEHVCHLLNAG